MLWLLSEIPPQNVFTPKRVQHCQCGGCVLFLLFVGRCQGVRGKYHLDKVIINTQAWIFTLGVVNDW